MLQCEEVEFVFREVLNHDLRIDCHHLLVGIVVDARGDEEEDLLEPPGLLANFIDVPILDFVVEIIPLNLDVNIVV